MLNISLRNKSIRKILIIKGTTIAVLPFSSCATSTDLFHMRTSTLESKFIIYVKNIKICISIKAYSSLVLFWTTQSWVVVYNPFFFKTCKYVQKGHTQYIYCIPPVSPLYIKYLPTYS